MVCELISNLTSKIIVNLLLFIESKTILNRIRRVVEWDRYDIAKSDLFNEKIKWVCI